MVSLSVVLLQALVSVPAAYGFARYSFKGKKLLWGIVMLSLMIPLQITFIPVYILFAKMKILGTLLPQILPFIANGYGIFLIRQSFLQLPKELMESAYLDGAGEKEILLYIAIPHAKASILSAILISFISTWNSYFWPFVMTNKESNMPLTLAMQRLQDANQGVEWPTLMAANSILTLPVLILFLLLSKQILLSFGYQEEK
ncbi:carbohydrate ABC transporter permease [Oribacterium sp.]